MTGPSVAVVDTGTANQASILAALRRVGAAPVVVRDADVVLRADRVVIPGVGAFAAAMTTLRDRGLDAALRERIASGRSLLAICLGLQLLADGSEESPGVRGLGVLRATVQRLPNDVRVPQLGWNQVMPVGSGGLVSEGYAYFANSYVVAEAEPLWQPTFAEHGMRFVASMQRGPQLACQFHPELSGLWGHRLLADWCAAC